MNQNVITQVDLFKDLPPEVQDAIVGLVREKKFSEGVEIFKEGDPGDCLYLISSGKVRISKQVPGAGEEALAILKPGSYFGEMSLIDGMPRSAYAIAHEDATLYTIGRTEFHSMLRADADLAYHILMQFTRTLASRLRATNDRIQSFLAFSVWG